MNKASACRCARAEVVIGGAGFAGLALAIALRQGLGDPFAVTVSRSRAGARSIEGPARLGNRRRGTASV